MRDVINKPGNVYIVELEGQDASGKETFAKSLAEYINEFEWGVNLNVVNVSFPDYTSVYGKKVKEILHQPLYERDEFLLDDLMMLDRRSRMEYEMIMASITGDTVIICDRYHFSGFAYSNRNRYRAAETFLEEWNTLPKPDFILHFVETNEKSREIHKKQISEKTDKDSNETMDFQDIILTNYWDKMDYLSNLIHEELNNGVRIPQHIVSIGSNYNNKDFESLVVNDLKYWIDRKYPSYLSNL